MSNKTSKTDHIVRRLAKSNNKVFENYVVTRIWHLLDNTDVQFVTQQHVTRKSGSENKRQRALTDMYFPQIKLHVEVDEPHHFDSNGNRKLCDLIREADIIDATGHSIKRIEASTTIEELNSRVAEIVCEINSKLRSKFNGTIPKWDVEAEFNPITHINRGYIDVLDNVAFRTIWEACNCFGHRYKKYMRGFATHAKNKDLMLWFPSLYKHGDWENSISDDEETIFERKTNDHEGYFCKAIENKINFKKRITFARCSNSLGELLYRFKGVFQLDLEESKRQSKMVYFRDRESMRVNTVSGLAHSDDMP